jgi:hypothetical protein
MVPKQHRNILRHVVLWDILYIIIYITLLLYITHYILYRAYLEETSIFWEVILSSFHIKKCCKIVDNKEILPTVYNTGIYCSSDKVGTDYLVQYIFENSTVSINALWNSCNDMECCSSGCILMLLYAGGDIHFAQHHNYNVTINSYSG